jgi:hypothetical protein
VAEAGWALPVTSPSTELVLETDFFWFLQAGARIEYPPWRLAPPGETVQLSGSVRPDGSFVWEEGVRCLGEGQSGGALTGMDI